MPWMLPAAMIGSALLGAGASSKAASTQTKAAEQSGQIQKDIFERQVQLQEPWRQAGITALNKLIPEATSYTPFGMSQFQQDPGYAFRLSEGQKALERSAAARGGLLSGATGKALTRFGQDMGSQEYQNAFNRYQAERAARLAPLQSLAGVGQTTAQQIAGQAGQMGANVGEALQSGAAARASGYVGGANALTGALGQYLNYSQGQDYLNMLNAGRTGMTYTPGAGGGYTYGVLAPYVGPQQP